jgi:hypothetical protein
MKLFISYASPQRSIAEDLNVLLTARGHDVFFDRDDLAPGLEYRQAIRLAAESCDVFVFLISPESVAPRRYTLTEVGYRQRKVPRSSGSLLPVLVKPTLLSRIPPYLKTVTLLSPQGNLSAAIADAVDRLATPRQPGVGLVDAASTSAPSGAFDTQRIAVYRRLWELTRVLPRWPRTENVPYADLRKLSAALRDWYFVDGGGLFLSRSAHSAYALVQNTLQAVLGLRATGPIAPEHYDEVRETCSALRSQLAKDVGARD